MKRKQKRSREFRETSKVVDIEDARRERREKRKKHAEAEAKKRAAAEKQTESARKKAMKNRRRLVYLAVIFLFLAVGGYFSYKIISLRAEKKELEAKHEELVVTKERLENELESVNTPEYIEQQARSHLRLILPGEILYILPDSDEQDAGSGDTAAEQ